MRFFCPASQFLQSLIIIFFWKKVGMLTAFYIFGFKYILHIKSFVCHDSLSCLHQIATFNNLPGTSAPPICMRYVRCHTTRCYTDHNLGCIPVFVRGESNLLCCRISRLFSILIHQIYWPGSGKFSLKSQGEKTCTLSLSGQMSIFRHWRCITRIHVTNMLYTSVSVILKMRLSSKLILCVRHLIIVRNNWSCRDWDGWVSI